MGEDRPRGRTQRPLRLRVRTGDASAQRLIYGRRTGHRLRTGQSRLLDEVLPQLRLTLGDAGQLTPWPPFADDRPLWLEIGFGAGEHLAWQASHNPEVGLIGCEPYLSGVAKLLSKREREPFDNLRLVVDDARLLLQALPEAALSRAFVLFPDPWPKTRHHKRRIVNPTTASELVRVLRPGGELRLATDDPGYARWMLQVLRARPELEWLARRPVDWRLRPDDWPATRYEEKAVAAGRRPAFLRFVRR